MRQEDKGIDKQKVDFLCLFFTEKNSENKRVFKERLKGKRDKDILALKDNLFIA